MLPQQIIRNINKELNIDIREKSRKREIVEGRIIFAKMMHSQNIYSLGKIGSYINKEYCTIIHYLKVHNNLFETDKNYKKMFKVISGDFFSTNKLTELKPCEFKIQRYNENISKSTL